MTMLMEQERNDIVAYGNRLLAEGLTMATAGNISIYDPETGYMAISPSGIPYADTRPEDVVIMKLDGTIVDGTAKPSSEHDLHAVFYRLRKDARAVVHTHSMFCTTLATMGEPLRAVHFILTAAGVDTIPIAPYYTYGTPELAHAVEESLGDKSRAVLLANHGLVTFGDSIKSAYDLAANCEWCAELQWRCMAAGTPNILTHEQMQDATEHFKTYGQNKKD